MSDRLSDDDAAADLKMLLDFLVIGLGDQTFLRPDRERIGGTIATYRVRIHASRDDAIRALLFDARVFKGLVDAGH
jgi:hypothetical protein